MQCVALYNVRVSGPLHAKIVSNIACRAALGKRGVAHLTIPKDVQAMRLEKDTPSAEHHELRTSDSWQRARDGASDDELARAAAILNTGQKIAILAGQGALGSRDALAALADRLGAPVAKSLLGKALLADDSPLSVGGIGHLGTLPSKLAMAECDTLLIVGSTMPWNDYYPRPGTARAIQIDIDPAHIGLRYPVELGIVADAGQTLPALLPRVAPRADRTFLSLAQSRMRQWNALIERIELDESMPMRPQAVVRAVSDVIADNAIVTLDCGANTHFAARHLRIRDDQSVVATGMLATMAPGLPFAVAAKLAQPDRPCVAIVGDGGLAMLMAEISTAVMLKLPIKVVVLRNDSLGEVQFEQKDLGNPVFGCALGPIDFVAFAQACGAEGVRCSRVAELRPTLAAAMRSPNVTLVEAIVDPNEAPLTPEKLARKGPGR